MSLSGTFSYKNLHLFICLNFIPYCFSQNVQTKTCLPLITYERQNVSSIGRKCSTENDAYVFGSMLYHFSSKDQAFGRNSVVERWNSSVNLDASKYDASHGSSNCIVNERLRKEHKISATGLPVATNCDPFDLTYCRVEYNGKLFLNQTCDCNYLYAKKGNDGLGKSKCYARAGVPCQFELPFKLGEQTNLTIECIKSLTCKAYEPSEVQAQLANSFQGIGMVPPIHEFMVAHAVGYCDCNNTNHVINAMNECVEGDATKLSRILLIEFILNLLAFWAQLVLQ